MIRSKVRRELPREVSGNPSTPTPRSELLRRHHGHLEWITETERRPLRPIGTSAMDVAMRTESLLGELTNSPNVRIFRGVWSACAQTPLITHAVTAGARLILIESVAWPPGRYRVIRDGRVLCGEQYTGQSASFLLSAVRFWRRILPGDHAATALIIVHPTRDGEITLATTASRDLTWALADNAASTVLQHFQRSQNTSRRAVGALIAATAY